MKKYEKPAIELIEIKAETMLTTLSNTLLPGEEDDYSDIEEGVILPDGSVWD